VIRRAAGALLAAVACMATATAAWAAGPMAAPLPGIELATQTPTVGPGSRALAFGMELAVQAPDPVNDLLYVTIYNRLGSRSDFAASLNGKVHGRLRSFPPAPLGSLAKNPANGAYPVTIPVAPDPAHPDAVVLVDPGAYPVQVELRAPDNRLLAQLTTHLIYTGGLSSAQPKLAVAWVAAAHAPPALQSDGKTWRLPSGFPRRLAGLAAALASYPDVPVTLQPTPETLDALASVSDPSARPALTTIAQLSARATDQVVTGPYVRVDVPSMLNSGLDAELSAQVRRGRDSLTTDLGVRPDPRTWVEPGPLDDRSLATLVDRGVDRLVLPEADLASLPLSLRNFTLANPFTVLGPQGRRLEVASADDGLAAHFIASGDQVLAAHQLLADLAVIAEEQPSQGRGVVVLTPAGWQPDAGFVANVLDGLSGNPMAGALTIDQFFAGVPQLGRRIPLERTLAPLPEGSTTFSAASAVRGVRHQLDAFSAVLPAESSVYQDIERVLLSAESVEVRDRPRSRQVAAAGRLIDQQSGLIRVPSFQSLTITARQGRIPVTVTSRVPFEARVRLRLSSPKLLFRPATPPDGNCVASGSSETCTLSLLTPNTLLKIPIVARTAGVFTMVVALESPDGALTLASSKYTVRSTAASGVGVFLSIGAALFLALWWGRELGKGSPGRKGRLVPAPADDGPWDGPDDDEDDEAAASRGRRPARSWASPRSWTRPRSWTEPRSSAHVAVSSRASRLASARLRAVDPSPEGGTAEGAAEAGASSTVAEPVPGGDSEPAAGPGPGFGLTGPGAPGGPGIGGVAPGQGDADFSRNATVMAAGTLLSRLTGFGRVLALLYVLDVSRLADAYNIANTVPNILFDLVVGGVISATVVPVFVDQLNRNDEDEGWRAISAVLTVFTAGLAAMTLVFWALAPLLIRFYLLLNHTASASDQRAIATTLLRLFVPQLFLLGGIALTTALLNARRHFAAPAFSPVLNNLLTIAILVLFGVAASHQHFNVHDLSAVRRHHGALLLLGLGTTAGYLVQLVAQMRPLAGRQFRLRVVWDPHHPAVRTLLRLSTWTLGAVAANQVAFNLILVLAGHKGGDVTAFQAGFQFFQLPYAIFAVSIASVLTPDLSERWSQNDRAGFRSRMSDGLRLTMAIMVPAAVGYILLARPFIDLVLRHGHVSAAGAHVTGTVVMCFAAGLPGFSAFMLLMRAYQAMQDTRSMFWLYVVENALTLVLAIALFAAFDVAGLAVAWVGAYSVAAVVAFARLRGRTGGLDGSEVVASLGRVAAATAVMAGVVFLVGIAIGYGSSARLALRVGSMTAVGVAVYLLAARLFGVGELSTLFHLRRRTA
jgi:putative peptidoglycan lipid II flippase